MNMSKNKKTAAVITLGCKVNDVESGSIIRGLEQMGYEVHNDFVPAQLYIVNTCAVTAEAERKSRQTVGKALKSGDENAKVIVCGCAAEKNATAFLDKDKRVFAVVGAQCKNEVLEIVQSGFTKNGNLLKSAGRTYEEMPLPHCLKTRNFVKIQDGCDRFCSYCVIPYLRGRSRSRSVESAATEILASTAMETVVTGIDISAYQDEEGKTLTALMLDVKDANTRIRLGSMEVSLITDEFLSALQQVKNFAPQFHLSLQSGSDKVLKSMNRHYTRAEYLDACKRIYAAFENAAITTDIIVGFPTETQEDFEDSIRIVREAGFAQIHAFPYSPREGTNAYKKYKELPFAVKKQRVEALLQVGAEEKERYMRKFVDKTLTVVPERCIDGYIEGYSENYIRVYTPSATLEADKKPFAVRVTKLFKDGVKAEKIEK